MSTVNAAWRGPNIVKNGLVLYLDANSGTSYNTYSNATTWKDISGNGYNGTLTNGPTFNSANGGNIVFDGVDDYCVFTYTWPTVFTLSMWLYFIGGTGAYPRIISTGSDYNFELSIDSLGRLSYYPSVGGAWTDNVTTVSKNAWINLVFIDNNDAFTIYNNGSLAYTGTVGTRANSFFVYIAQSKDLGSERTNIQVSNLQIYNRALSTTEILQNYNSTKARFGL